jgi:hypothetical protein
MSGQRRVDTLLDLGTAESYAALLDLQRSTESPRLLTYLGVQISRNFNPQLFPHIEHGFRAKSFPFMKGVLEGMAACEQSRLLAQQPAQLAGKEHAPLRRILAEFCCEPIYGVAEKVWCRSITSVVNASRLPMGILPRVAAEEVAEVALRALVKGGVSPGSNVAAIDLIKLFEYRAPTRQLTESQITTLLGVFADDLRQGTVHASISSLVGVWLRKSGQPLSEQFVTSFLQTTASILDTQKRTKGCARPQALNAVIMLHHLKVGDGRVIIENAAAGGGRGISDVASLCSDKLREGYERRLDRLLSREADAEERFSALLIFCQSISPEVDERTFPHFQRYLTALDESVRNELRSQGAWYEQMLLVDSLARRFLTEPLDSFFISKLLGSIVSEAPQDSTLKMFAVDVFLRVTEIGFIAPVWFYKDISGARIALAAATVVSKRYEAVAGQGHGELGRRLIDFFISFCPTLYGVRCKVRRGGDSQGDEKAGAQGDASAK